jgi:hypothetical protein
MVTTRRARPTSPVLEDSPLETRPSPEAKRFKFDESPQSSHDAGKENQEQPEQEPSKPFRFEYPSFNSIPVPSKSILKALLQQALKLDNVDSEQLKL